jgi:undecaprenyl phosphate-alpha-L-ara4N flippase subunit ArnE
MSPLLPLSGGVVLNAVAQIALRHGVSGNTAGRAGQGRFWICLWAIFFSLATLLWLIALRHIAISYAYPLLGAGYILVTLMAKWFLREEVSAFRWASILVITAGVVMVGANQ